MIARLATDEARWIGSAEVFANSSNVEPFNARLIRQDSTSLARSLDERRAAACEPDELSANSRLQFRTTLRCAGVCVFEGPNFSIRPRMTSCAINRSGYLAGVSLDRDGPAHSVERQ